MVRSDDDATTPGFRFPYTETNWSLETSQKSPALGKIKTIKKSKWCERHVLVGQKHLLSSLRVLTLTPKKKGDEAPTRATPGTVNEIPKRNDETQ